jgi:hypothetical protein
MAEASQLINAYIDASQRYQEIDGFGVNINSRYWKNDALLPVMELLLDDLGATLFRVDIWGKSNWVDPHSQMDHSALNPQTLAAIYQGEIFQRGWGLMRYLNARVIHPYLAASGDVPRWMLAQDGRTLADVESFCEMLVSMVEWARRQEKLDFSLFGPLNETDVGSPEGPALNPPHFAGVIQRLDRKLSERSLDEIRLVVAEQGGYNADYVSPLVSDEKLAGRLGVVGMHMYANQSADEMKSVVDLVRGSPGKNCRLWLTEYGDLEQSGEREWYVSWMMTQRLFNALEAGFQGALAWDAFDNYHDHDEAWTIYGLIRTGLRTFTPKKRYHAAKQVYRFVRPGYWRVDARVESPEVRLLAFADPAGEHFTLVGMNTGREAYLNIHLEGFEPQTLGGRAGYYRTSQAENCALVGTFPIRTRNWPFDGLSVEVPGDCIFTLTRVL